MTRCGLEYCLKWPLKKKIKTISQYFLARFIPIRCDSHDRILKKVLNKKKHPEFIFHRLYDLCMGISPCFSAIFRRKGVSVLPVCLPGRLSSYRIGSSRKIKNVLI